MLRDGKGNYTSLGRCCLNWCVHGLNWLFCLRSSGPQGTMWKLSGRGYKADHIPSRSHPMSAWPLGHFFYFVTVSSYNFVSPLFVTTEQEGAYPSKNLFLWKTSLHNFSFLLFSFLCKIYNFTFRASFYRLYIVFDTKPVHK